MTTPDVRAQAADLIDQAVEDVALAMKQAAASLREPQP